MAFVSVPYLGLIVTNIKSRPKEIVSKYVETNRHDDTGNHAQNEDREIFYRQHAVRLFLP